MIDEIFQLLTKCKDVNKELYDNLSMAPLNTLSHSKIRDVLTVLKHTVEDIDTSEKDLYRSWMTVVQLAGHNEIEFLQSDGEYNLSYYDDYGRIDAASDGEAFVDFCKEYYKNRDFFPNEDYRKAFKLYFIEGVKQKDLTDIIFNHKTGEYGVSITKISNDLKALKNKMLNDLKRKGKI